MRHDPASAPVVVMLRGLKTYGMAGAASDLIELGAPAFDTAVPILSQLLIPKRDESDSLRFGQARAALEHFQGLMRQHLRALVSKPRWPSARCVRSPIR
jgi:hypothetical protein